MSEEMLQSTTTASASDDASPPEASWGQRTGRNVVALAGARGAVALSTLVLTAYLTRTLEPSTYGILGFGTALLGYFTLFTHLGLDTLGTREIARAPDHARLLAGRITGIKLVLGTIAYALFLGVVFVLPKPPLFRLVLSIQGLTVFAHAISVEWVYQGVERMGILAVRNVATALLHLGIVLGLVHAPEDVVWAAAAGVIALFVLNLWLLVSLVRDFGRLDLSLDLEAWRSLLPPALPIAGSVFLIAIYYNLDQVILGLLRNETEVGWYTAACRAMTAALLPSLVFGQAFFPALSSVFGDLPAMRERARAFATAMIPVGLPIGLGMALLARPLLVLFAGEDYAPGGPALSILMLNAALVYFNMVYGQSLLAWNYQKVYMLAVGTGALINIVLNFILIPSYGPVGAAAATFAAQSGAFLWVWVVHRRVTGQAYADVFIRALAASLLGVVAPILLGQHLALPLLPLLVVVAGLYGSLAWGLGLIPRTLFRGLRPG